MDKLIIITLLVIVAVAFVASTELENIFVPAEILPEDQQAFYKMGDDCIPSAFTIKEFDAQQNFYQDAFGFKYERCKVDGYDN